VHRAVKNKLTRSSYLIL